MKKVLNKYLKTNHGNTYFTQDKIDFLREHSKNNTLAGLAELFNTHYKTNKTLPAIRTALYKHGIKLKPGYIGNEYIQGGETFLKISNTGTKKDYVRKNRYIWEQANGAIPPGHYIIFADGNKQNFDPDNLLCVSYYELLTLNSRGFNNFNNAELTKLHLTQIRLNNAIIKKVDKMIPGDIKAYKKKNLFMKEAGITELLQGLNG